MPSADTFRFVCNSCSYRARIPLKYAGATIKCPGCSAAQVADPTAAEGPSTGDTVAIAKVDTTNVPSATANVTPPSGKMRFVCQACGYRAKIPVKYAGMAIKCPGCGTPQTAEEQTSSQSTGDTVAIAKVDVSENLPDPAGAGAPADEPAPSRYEPRDKFRFVCPACSYRARIPSKYAGKTIKCPGCGTAQTAVVGDESASSVTGDTVMVRAITTADVPKPTPEPSILGPSGAAGGPPPGSDEAVLDLAGAPGDDSEPVINPLDDPALASGSTPPERAEASVSADGIPQFDPFSKETPAEDPSEAAANQDLLNELRSGDSPAAAPAAKPKPSEPRAPRPATARRQRPSANDSAPAPTPKPAPSAAPQPAAPAGGSSKAPLLVLVVLLLAALGAGGWLFMQWQSESAAHDSTKSTLDSTNSTLASTNSTLDSTKSSLASTEATLAATTESLTTTTAERDALITERDGLNEDLTGLQSAHATLTARAGELETTVAGLTSDLQQRDQSITELTDSVAERDARITELNASLEAAQAQAAELQERLETSTGISVPVGGNTP